MSEDEITLSVYAEKLISASSLLSEDTSRVTFVDHQHGVVFIAKGLDFI